MAPVPPSSFLYSSFPVPFKHERPFPNGARGMTTWFTTESPFDIPIPPSGLQVVAGTLYIHFNASKNSRQIWLFDVDAGWKAISDVTQASHPSYRDQTLNIRSDRTPCWVASTLTTDGRGRRVKK